LAEVRADQLTTYGVSLEGRHLDIAHQDGVGANSWRRVDAIGSLDFGQQQLAAGKQRHGLAGWNLSTHRSRLS